jgi:hypothetical protein
MLALMAIVEVGLEAGGAESWALALWRGEARSVASEAAVRAEVLCLGDSLVKTGVVPAALEVRLDRTTYNLGAWGSPTPLSYFLLRRALDAGARPRALVLDAHEPQLWSSNRRADIAAWAGLIRPTEALRLALDAGDPGFFGLYLVHRLVPSVRLRHDVRAAVADRLAGRVPRSPVPWSPVVARQQWRNRGAVLFRRVEPSEEPRPWALADASADAGGGTCRDVLATNLDYLDRLLALARSRGIAVFLVVPPLHPVVQAERERLGQEASYLGLLRPICERYDNVVVVDGRHSGYSPGQFLDSCHMHVEGALAFSQGLAEVMADRLDAPARGDRWVDLPPYAEPPARLAVETVDESEWAVAWERTRR